MRGLVIALLVLGLIASPITHIAHAEVQPDAPEGVKCFFARLLGLVMFVGVIALVGALIVAGLYYVAGRPQPEKMGAIIVGAVLIIFAPLIVSWLAGISIDQLLQCTTG